ncbi:MAG TPA: hypothetical protein VGS27_16920 [Candidatus Sulfotelmatobacter sp.]|nr:hypothetical protein [Candidatus Sulfotelmatobacter sp.]
MPISTNVVLGQGVKIFQPELVDLYGCALGDDTKVGAIVEIQRNAFIGRRSTEGRLQTEQGWHTVPTRVKCGASIGRGAVILAGVTIGGGALIGAGAVVTHDVPDHHIAKGVPARLGPSVLEMQL